MYAINFLNSTKKYQNAIASECKTELQKSRKNVKASIIDIKNLILASLDDNFYPMHNTKLYQNYGAEYCELLGIVKDTIQKYSLH